MLPFMKIKRVDQGQIVEIRKPDKKQEDSEDDGLEVAMLDLAEALGTKDKKAAAAAFRAAFQILETEPHSEAELEQE